MSSVACAYTGETTFVLRAKDRAMAKSKFTDLERKAYAFALYTVLVLDQLKLEVQWEERGSYQEFIADLDRVIDQAFRFQLAMLVEDPELNFDEISGET